jgi:hypothetical protein
MSFRNDADHVPSYAVSVRRWQPKEVSKCNLKLVSRVGELNDLYFLSIIVRVVKSRRMRWAGHVARMGEVRDRKSVV